MSEPFWTFSDENAHFQCGNIGVSMTLDVFDLLLSHTDNRAAAGTLLANAVKSVVDDYDGGMLPMLADSLLLVIPPLRSIEGKGMAILDLYSSLQNWQKGWKHKGWIKPDTLAA
jgi:hypothetical protein